MKKALSKLRLKRTTTEETSGRITSDTIAEHREQVLAGGRKFKYPLQYARHRLVFNAILIGLAAVIILVGVAWWQLYPAQNTSDFMYRVTKVLPVPVAVVDSEQVRYSDYLMKYRSSIHYLAEKEAVNLGTEDGKRQQNFNKRQALDNAIADAYATKLARDLGIAIADAQLEAFLVQQRSSSDGETVSEATYNAVILDYYGWSPEEYRHAMREKLLRQEVVFAVDGEAAETADAITAQVKAGATDLKAIAESVNQSSGAMVIYWPGAWVPRTNQDGGLATTAAKLQKGQISEAIRTTSGDGYYFIKLIDSNDAQVQYEYIQVPLTAFSKKLQEVKNNGGVQEYIAIPDTAIGE